MSSKIGEIIAFQAEDGHVYTGFVTGFDDQGRATVDVVSDGLYREAGAGVCR